MKKKTILVALALLLMEAAALACYRVRACDQAHPCEAVMTLPELRRAERWCGGVWELNTYPAYQGQGCSEYGNRVGYMDCMPIAIPRWSPTNPEPDDVVSCWLLSIADVETASCCTLCPNPTAGCEED